MAVSLGRFRINLCTKLFTGRFFFNLNFLFGLFEHKFSKIGLWQRPLCRFWINLWTNISFNDLFLLYEFLLFEIGLFQYEFSKTGLRLWALLFDQTANVYFEKKNVVFFRLDFVFFKNRIFDKSNFSKLKFAYLFYFNFHDWSSENSHHQSGRCLRLFLCTGSNLLQCMKHVNVTIYI